MKSSPAPLSLGRNPTEHVRCHNLGRLLGEAAENDLDQNRGLKPVVPTAASQSRAERVGASCPLADQQPPVGSVGAPDGGGSQGDEGFGGVGGAVAVSEKTKRHGGGTDSVNSGMSAGAVPFMPGMGVSAALSVTARIWAWPSTISSMSMTPGGEPTVSATGWPSTALLQPDVAIVVAVKQANTSRALMSRSHSPERAPETGSRGLRRGCVISRGAAVREGWRSPGVAGFPGRVGRDLRHSVTHQVPTPDQGWNQHHQTADRDGADRIVERHQHQN